METNSTGRRLLDESCSVRGLATHDKYRSDDAGRLSVDDVASNSELRMHRQADSVVQFVG